jgi:hypothetical protein
MSKILFLTFLVISLSVIVITRPLGRSSDFRLPRLRMRRPRFILGLASRPPRSHEYILLNPGAGIGFAPEAKARLCPSVFESDYDAPAGASALNWTNLVSRVWPVGHQGEQYCGMLISMVPVRLRPRS